MAHQRSRRIPPFIAAHAALLLALMNPQASVSRARVESFSLVADMMYMATNAPRILRAVFEIALR